MNKLEDKVKEEKCETKWDRDSVVILIYTSIVAASLIGTFALSYIEKHPEIRDYLRKIF